MWGLNLSTIFKALSLSSYPPAQYICQKRISKMQCRMVLNVSFLPLHWGRQPQAIHEVRAGVEQETKTLSASQASPGDQDISWPSCYMKMKVISPAGNEYRLQCLVLSDCPFITRAYHTVVVGIQSPASHTINAAKEKQFFKSELLVMIGWEKV